MRAFKISVNGKKLCVAGIGDEGVLSAIVNWVAGVRGKSRGDGDLFLHVGGLVSPTNVHVAWATQKPLQIGDEIRIKVVETPVVDEPIEKGQRLDPARELKAKKRYVRTTAKELGWKIQARPKRPTS
jgi:hypothetical protein